LGRADIPGPFRPLFEPYEYKAVYGGRGSGKSHSFATALLIQGRLAPLRILCAREIQLSIKDSVKQLLDDKIEALGLTGFYDSLQNEIRGKNGTQFIFSGLGKMTVEQIKSMEGIDRAWIEEAQTISDRSLEVLVPTIRKANSELWFSWNPRHASDPVDALFRGEIVPDTAFIRRVNYDENPFFPEGLDAKREFDKRHKPDRYGHIWLGDYEPTAIGAIWDRLTIHQGRRTDPPELERILVAVDPAVSSESGADEHGIVVVAEGGDGRGYVLDDVSMKGSPKQWADRAIAAFDRYEADAVVIEINQGGDMVRHTLESVRPGLSIVEVRATRGKHVRAEPISALYSLGKISHVGAFPKLEDQMCQMTAAGYEGEGSPDRVDALVWGFTELFPNLTSKPSAEPEERSRPARSGGWMGA
jgi:hypothetical protein